MHVTEYQIAQYLDGKLTGKQKSEFEEHITECDQCLEEFVSAYRMIKHVESTSVSDPDPGIIYKAENLISNNSSSNVIPLKNRRYRLASAFAFLIAAVGILFYFLNPQSPEAEQFRSGEDAYSIQLLTPNDGDSISQTDVELQWEEVRNALFYAVNLFEEDGTLLTSFETDSAHLVISGEEHLTTGNTYFWRSEGILNDGRVIQSEMNVFTYNPR